MRGSCAEALRKLDAEVNKIMFFCTVAEARGSSAEVFSRKFFFLSFCSNFVFHDLFPKNNLFFRIFATTATTTTTNEDDDGAKTVVGISPPTTA